MGLEPRTGQLCALRVYGYLYLHFLGTPVDKRWVLLACKNKLCDPLRHRFRFEQVSFQYMLPRLSYQRAKKCRQTDRQTAFQLYIVDIYIKNTLNSAMSYVVEVISHLQQCVVFDDAEIRLIRTSGSRSVSQKLKCHEAGALKVWCIHKPSDHFDFRCFC